MRPGVLTCILTGVVACSGCVERKLLVRSDPPQAVVYLDGRRQGATDEAGELEVSFEHYGTREVMVRKAGHVPERRSVEVDPPWYQVFPIGLLSDVLWPGTIVDEHRPEPFRLTRRGEPRPAEEAQAEAEELRRAAEDER